MMSKVITTFSFRREKQRTNEIQQGIQTAIDYMFDNKDRRDAGLEPLTFQEWVNKP